MTNVDLSQSHTSLDHPPGQSCGNCVDMLPALVDDGQALMHVKRSLMGYDAFIHGDFKDKYGRVWVDVQFTNVHAAASYADTVNSLGWHADIRNGDEITSLRHSVTLEIHG